MTLANINDQLSLLMTLADALSYGIGKNTWKVYKTAANHVEQICVDLGVNLSFPFSLENIMTYISYLISII